MLLNFNIQLLYTHPYTDYENVNFVPLYESKLLYWVGILHTGASTGCIATYVMLYSESLDKKLICTK